MKKPVNMSLSQNSVSFGKGFRKSGLKPAFSIKSKVAFPKTEVLGKPHIKYAALLFLLFFLLPAAVYSKSHERMQLAYHVENISDMNIFYIISFTYGRTVSGMIPVNSAFRILDFRHNPFPPRSHQKNLSGIESLSLFDETGSMFFIMDDIREDSFFTEAIRSTDHFLQIRQRDIELGRVRHLNMPGLDITGEGMQFLIDSSRMQHFAPVVSNGERKIDWEIEDGVLLRYLGTERNIVIPRGVTAIGNEAFRGSRVISVEIPDTVVSIGAMAFYASRSLESINLPDSIVQIGAEAFSRTASLRFIRLPANLREISPGLFAGSGLWEVELPENLVNIGDIAFAGCVSLRNIVIPHGVVSIGHQAFRSNWAMRSVVIPGTVKEMGDNIFIMCKALESVTIGHGLRRIGHSMFAQCISLVSINLPSSVEVIGGSAFFECINLVSVKMSGVRLIERHAFWGCRSLRDITFPETLTRIEERAFAITPLANIELPKNFSCLGENIFWMGRIQNIKVHQDNPYFASFDGVLFDKNFTSLVLYPSGRTDYEYHIPESVIAIGPNAFFESNLHRVHFPEGLQRIEYGAFMFNRNLAAIELPKSLVYLGPRAFEYNRSLEEVIIPPGIREIKYQTFSRCINLRSVILPPNLERIGEHAFSGTGFTTITLPENLVYIGERAFSSSSLQQIIIPPKIREIRAQVFTLNRALTDISLPSDLEIIGHGAFHSNAFTTIELPSNLRIIGQGAFSNNSNLRYLVIPDSVEEIGSGVFNRSNNIEQISLSSSTSIDIEAFPRSIRRVIVFRD